MVELRWPTWIGVVCEDLEAQRRFYRDVLSLEEAGHGPDWVWFRIGSNLFELLERSDRPQYDRTRYQTGFTVDDIGAARAELIERGVEAITDVEGGPESGQYWCYFRDPEGNVFELVQRAPSEPPKEAPG